MIGQFDVLGILIGRDATHIDKCQRSNLASTVHFTCPSSSTVCHWLALPNQSYDRLRINQSTSSFRFPVSNKTAFWFLTTRRRCETVSEIASTEIVKKAFVKHFVVLIFLKFAVKVSQLVNSVAPILS